MATRLRFLHRAYRYRYLVDPGELRFICRRLGRDQVAVDVGCHKGAYTYWMRRRVGGAGRVIAFEPQPRQIEYLRRALAAMRYENVTLVPAALSDAPGRLALHMATGNDFSTHAATLEAGSEERGTGGADSRSLLLAPCSVLVDVTTLDAFFASQPRGPDFVKIDVEGHELAVLEGGRQTLAEHRPTLLVECEARHRPDGDVRPVFDLLQSLGYTGSFFHRGGRRPLAEFDPAVHQPPISRSERPPPGYVNNFAFEHGT